MVSELSERRGEAGGVGGVGEDVSEREAVHVWQRQCLDFTSCYARYKWMIY